jgi:DNA-directed RNA polymerase specialized sigma24 family protein
MPDNGLSKLFEQAQAGDKDAEDQIAQIFLPRALELSRKKLPVAPSPMVDQEDLAISAINSLCRCIRNGNIEFRGDRILGGLLKDIVVKKSAHYWRTELTQKRNRNAVLGEADISASNSGLHLAGLATDHHESIFVNDHSVILNPDESIGFHQVLQSLERSLHGLFKELFQQLDEKPRKMLLLMLDTEYSNQQMAEKLGCSIASVERYRSSIKRKIFRIVEGSE